MRSRGRRGAVEAGRKIRARKLAELHSEQGPRRLALFLWIEMSFDDLACRSGREGIALGREIGGGDRLGDRRLIIEVQRGEARTRHREPNTLEAALGARISSAVRRGRDQHLPGARGAHAVHRKHIADAIHDRESRRMASRPRLVDPSGQNLLDVALRQHLSRARAGAVTACRGLVSPSRRLHAVTPAGS